MNLILIIRRGWVNALEKQQMWRHKDMEGQGTVRAYPAHKAECKGMQRMTVLLSNGKSLMALESGPRNLVSCKLNLGCWWKRLSGEGGKWSWVRKEVRDEGVGLCIGQTRDKVCLGRREVQSEQRAEEEMLIPIRDLRRCHPQERGLKETEKWRHRSGETEGSQGSRKWPQFTSS